MLNARSRWYEHVEVDVDRQVLLLVNGNDAVRVLPISTGSSKPFMDEGQKSISYAPSADPSCAHRAYRLTEKAKARSKIYQAGFLY